MRCGGPILPAPRLPFCGVIAAALARRFKVSPLTHYGRGAETHTVRAWPTSGCGGELPPTRRRIGHRAATIASYQMALLSLVDLDLVLD